MAMANGVNGVRPGLQANPNIGVLQQNQLQPQPPAQAVQRPFPNMADPNQRPASQNGTSVSAVGGAVGAPVTAPPQISQANMAAMDNIEFRSYQGNARFDTLMQKVPNTNLKTWGDLKNFFRSFGPNMPQAQRDQMLGFVCQPVSSKSLY